jgi:group I intron endonuclease
MIVYKTTNTINGKFYVGQDSNNNPKYLGSGILLNRAIEKYGREYFIKEVLEVCNTKEQLNEREKYWIHELNAKQEGYNIADGGRGGNTYTEETIQRVSKLLTGRYVSPETIEKRKELRKKHPERYIWTDEMRKRLGDSHRGKTLSEETKRKLSEKLKLSTDYSPEFLYQQTKDKRGENGPMWNKQHSEETRKKMSESHKNNPIRYWSGKKQSSESNEKRRQASLKFRHTEEHKQSIRGEGNPFFGCRHTEETKKKISNSRKLKTPDQKLERYIKFYISRTGNEPSEEQKLQKYREYLNVQ